MIHCFFTAILVLILTGCSDQKQIPIQAKLQDNTPWITYRDARYPLTLKYPGLSKYESSPNEIGKNVYFGNTTDDVYYIDIFINLL